MIHTIYRAIFRWITVKDLNVMKFSDTLQSDTPFGILRGIKMGTETYHVLFMRLCSYAGLHCVDIKGHSKSVGYEPGMAIKDNSFTNTWNAVFVDGNWRFVQCNWGARYNFSYHKSPQSYHFRHLVLDKEKQDREEKIRYQYDDHYFLTDPEQFIYEFFPYDSEWQLLQRPLTMEQFEQLPFVRSLFFQYRLEFKNQPAATIYADQRGSTEIKLRMPEELRERLAFHFHMRQSSGNREMEGIKLERFVLQLTVKNTVNFKIQLPQKGRYVFEIFANLVDTQQLGEAFKLKCVCKYAIICESQPGRVVPLPDCAPGEWGPLKALRHFGIQVLTHHLPVINTENPNIIMQFKLPRLLKFQGKLQRNWTGNRSAGKITTKVDVEYLILTVEAAFPAGHEDQYGLELFAREIESKSKVLTHCCKYLVNYRQANGTVQL